MKKIVKAQPNLLLKNLNSEQLKAVKHTEGALLVLAGAGTGKTRVITYRIAHLLEKGVAPENILAVTFTTKAAEEMRIRVENLVPGKGKLVWISTFHSFGARFLRMETKKLGLYPYFVIYDEIDQKDLLKECIRELNLEEKKYRPGLFAEIINRAKDDLIDYESYAILSVATNDSFRQIAALVYQKYQKKLLLANALDFGDLIMRTVFALRDIPALRDKYQEQFHYLLIDEYQDTNRGQYVLTKYLAGKYKNICVVGDDDQAIYSWRGANIRNLLEFEKDYPNTKVIKLERNYRSTPEILDSAWRVVKNNRYRKEKKLWTKRIHGRPVIYEELSDEIEEAKYVVSEILSLRNMPKSTYSFTDMAIFYRMNAQSRVFEDYLRKEKIPYKIVGTVRFYERTEIKDTLAYLKLIYNPSDTLSLKRIINSPPRGIGKTTLAKIEKYALENNLSLFETLERIEKVPSLSPKTVSTVKEFISLIEDFIKDKDKLSVQELTKLILDKTGYIRELELEDTIMARIRIENLKELISAISEFEERSADKSLTAYLEQVSLISSAETLQLPGEKKETVTLMTLHLAKGLEFPVVFVTGLEEGLLPLGDTFFSQEELEEERRLCYVGMTRAKDILYLTNVRVRKIYGQSRECIPSRFIDEAKLSAESAELPQRTQKDSLSVLGGPFASFARFRVGERVRHPDFGFGKVIEKSGSGENLKVTIRFDTGETKKLLVKYANLEKI